MKSAFSTFQAMKELPVNVAILDRSGIILGVNNLWKKFGKTNGLKTKKFGVGTNYLQCCEYRDPEQSLFLKRLKDLLAGRRNLLTHIYPCHSPSKERWFSLIGVPLSMNSLAGIALLHVNITDTLPTSAGHGQINEKMDGRRKFHNAVDVKSISDAIESSAANSLSSQLDSMFATSHLAALRRHAPYYDRLSDRQKQVLQLLAQGQSNTEIAKTLSRSKNTVKLHVSAILKKLKVKSRTQAALLSANLNDRR